MLDNSTQTQLYPCPGCGARFTAGGPPQHPYIGANAGCWTLYGEILAREYQGGGYEAVHRLTADTYAVQHPGIEERRSIQSVGVHLIALNLALARQMPFGRIPGIMQKIIEGGGGFRWLEPPEKLGNITVADLKEVAGPEQHCNLVRQWAKSVWSAWSAHHEIVEQWTLKALGGYD